MIYLARALGFHRSSFSPEELEVMRRAYSAACAELSLDQPGDRLTLADIVLTLMSGRTDLRAEALKADSVLRFQWEKSKR